MAKKGEISLYTVGEAVAAVLIFFIGVSLPYAYLEGNLFGKKNVANDIASQIHALSSLPGDGYIVTQNVYDISIELTGNTIAVYSDPEDIFQGKAKIVPTSIPVEEILLERPIQFVVIKRGNTITVTDTFPDS